MAGGLGGAVIMKGIVGHALSLWVTTELNDLTGVHDVVDLAGC
jgi:hypothetical protein